MPVCSVCLELLMSRSSPRGEHVTAAPQVTAQRLRDRSGWLSDHGHLQAFPFFLTGSEAAVHPHLTLGVITFH